jgi:hypothetical protein
MHDPRVDRLLRLPLEQFSEVLRDDAKKFGLLADRVGAVLLKRLRKKAAKRRSRHHGATMCLRSQSTDNMGTK